jgi:hypothetical protein
LDIEDSNVKRGSGIGNWISSSPPTNSPKGSPRSSFLKTGSPKGSFRVSKDEINLDGLINPSAQDSGVDDQEIPVSQSPSQVKFNIEH